MQFIYQTRLKTMPAAVISQEISKWCIFKVEARYCVHYYKLLNLIHMTTTQT